MEQLKRKKWRGGRRKLSPKEKLMYKIQIHVNQAEFEQIEKEFKASGKKSKSDYLRDRLLKKGKQLLAVNPVEFLRQLDRIGTETGRIGNNINQVAKYAHILAHQGKLDDGPLREFNHLMDEYMRNRRELIKAYRAVIRIM